MAMVLPMDWKELMEARRIGVPQSIIGKMIIGEEPSEREKEIINKLGKVYVESYKKNGKWVKPQLRDLPEGSSKVKRKRNKEKEIIFSDEEIEKLIDGNELWVSETESEGYVIADLIDDIDANKDSWFPAWLSGEEVQIRYSTYYDGYQIKK